VRRRRRRSALAADHALHPHPDVGLDVLHVADVERRVGVGQGGGDEELAVMDSGGARLSQGETSILGGASLLGPLLAPRASGQLALGQRRRHPLVQQVSVSGWP